MSGRVIVIGASFNGIAALCELAKALPVDLPAPVLVVQHTAPTSPGFLPSLLSRAGPLPARHPRDGEAPEPGRIYVAPPDRHLVLDAAGRIHLSHGPRENHTRPAVDPTFRSAALAFGPAVVGVVLTGYLDDGTAGLLAIKDRGGVAIAQEPAEALAPSMPTSALRHVAVDHRAPLAEIARLIVELAKDAPGVAVASTDLMETECRIAEGVAGFADWQAIERASHPSGLSCPDCGSVLQEMADRRMLRFRCRAGHAFSGLSLLDAQAEARDDRLSALFGALVEEATLAKRLLALGEETSTSPAHLHERAEWLEGHAARVSEWLAHPPFGGSPS